MPEIWLPYGNVEVVVEVKVENLYNVFEPKYRILKEEEIESKLKEIVNLNYDKILLLDYEIAGLKILSKIFELGIKSEGVRIFVQSQYLSKVKKTLSGYRVKVIPISEKEKERIGFQGISFCFPKSLIELKEGKGIVISNTGFDPLFGYKGTPSCLARLAGKDLMAKIVWNISKEIEPKCGKINEAWKFAAALCKEFLRKWTAIELLSYHNEIINLDIGDVEEAHLNSIKKLFTFGVKDSQRIVIISPGREPYCSTLSSSLLSIWNSLEVMRNDGCVILVSECSEGLGSEALNLFTSGRVMLSLLMDKKEYVDGLEDLIYLTNLKLRNIILVSTLPKTFVEGRLGLTLARSVTDALAKAFEVTSSRAKVLVLPKGNLTKIIYEK